MKKVCFTLLCLSLALALTVSGFASIDVGTYKTKDGDYVAFDENEFSIDSPSEDLRPGTDYYLETEWGNGPMEDYFFDYHVLSTSYASDTEGVSNAAFGRHIAAAEFVKGKDGKYYYHVRVTSARSLNDDIDGAIIVYAKDKEDPDKRYAAVVELTIGYSSSELTVDDDEIDLPDGGAILEFEKGLKKCTLNFDNNSTLELKSLSTRKMNFCYSEDVSATIANANPNANLQQMTFYGRPALGERSRFRFNAGYNARYFYELTEDNVLTQVGTKNIDADGYFTVWTDRLGTYIASDIALKNAVVSSSMTTAVSGASETTPAQPVAANQPAALAPGWQRQPDGSMRYQMNDGRYPKGGWAQIGGKWYCFDQNGTLRTNQWIRNTTNDRIWYYVGANGEMVTNQYVSGLYLNAYGEYHGA